MADLIIAFPKLDDAKNLRKLLVRNGYDVNMVCDSGAQIVGAVNELDGGIIISGYKFSDMHYSEINDYLPKGFNMLLLASPAKLADCALFGFLYANEYHVIYRILEEYTNSIGRSSQYRWCNSMADILENYFP